MRGIKPLIDHCSDGKGRSQSSIPLILSFSHPGEGTRRRLSKFARADQKWTDYYPEELRALTSWKGHTLTGDRKGTWSLSVTRNRRLTFRVDTAEREVFDVDLEDYH